MRASGKRSIAVGAPLALFAILVAVPLLWRGDADFKGTDSAAQSLVEKEHPGVRPRAGLPWKPGSGETETLLFSLQAAAGAGLLGYVIGYLRGKRSVK